MTSQHFVLSLKDEQGALHFPSPTSPSLNEAEVPSQYMESARASNTHAPDPDPRPPPTPTLFFVFFCACVQSVRAGFSVLPPQTHHFTHNRWHGGQSLGFLLTVAPQRGVDPEGSAAATHSCGRLDGSTTGRL